MRRFLRLRDDDINVGAYGIRPSSNSEDASFAPLQGFGVQIDGIATVI
ncbi:MAG: hypothetical protein WA828_18710 [Coleofasciculaceae cyanobacterium]